MNSSFPRVLAALIALAFVLAACSNGSGGNDTRAAISVSVTSGVQCQMSMMTMVANAAGAEVPMFIVMPNHSSR